MMHKHILIVTTLFGSLLVSCGDSEGKEKDTEESQGQEQVAADTSATESSVVEPAVATPKDPALNEIAHIYAGLEVDSTSALYTLTQTPEWQEYHNQITDTWNNYDTVQHDKVEDFREQWLPAEVRGGRDLLYPFAGADFLYADLFFPDAENTYMFGLEPLGTIPKEEMLDKGYYNGVVRATRDLLRLTYFRTNWMREDFKKNGVVPLLCYFIVHRGHDVSDVEFVKPDEHGNLVSVDPDSATGARVEFIDHRTNKVRNVIYFQGDISDAALSKDLAMKQYIENLPQCNLYMKAASYICYHWQFDTICQTFVDHAELCLQEDSGAPLRYFPEANWDRKFFGTYVYPIPLFTDRIYRQKDELKNAFANPDQVYELPFPLGYHSLAGTDNLTLAIRK